MSSLVQLAFRSLEYFEVDNVLQFDEVENQLIYLAHLVLWSALSRFQRLVYPLDFCTTELFIFCDSPLALTDIKIILKIGFKFSNLPCDLVP